MTRVDLLITNASQLVTCGASFSLPADFSPPTAASPPLSTPPKRGAAMADPGIIADGAVAIRDGLIVAAGPTADLVERFEAARTIDAQGRAVCPGFVDAHTHVVYSGDRIEEWTLKLSGTPYLNILAAGGGILSTVRSVRAASVDQLVEESLPRLKAMLRLGTTTAEVKTGYALNTEGELNMLRAIEKLDAAQLIDLVPTFLGAHTVPPEFAGRTEAYVDSVIDDQIPAAAEWYKASSFAARGTPFFIDVFCEQNAFSLDQSRRILSAGRALGMRVKAHVDQFNHLGAAGLAISLDSASIDHLDVTPQDEIRQAAASRTVCVVIPAVNFHLGSAHFADARAMIDDGAAVALATDINPGSAPCPSMPLVMAIACRYQKLTPAEALCAATINAAAATAVDHLTGSIEPGKLADLLILNHPDYRHAMYQFGDNPVHTVIKRGEVYPNA